MRRPWAVLVIGWLLSMAFPFAGTTVAAQAPIGFPDLRSLVLPASELPGYSIDPTRTTHQERPDGRGTHDVVYVRDASAPPGPTEIRMAVARTASGLESMQSLAATREALLGASWSS